VYGAPGHWREPPASSRRIAPASKSPPDSPANRHCFHKAWTKQKMFGQWQEMERAGLTAAIDYFLLNIRKRQCLQSDAVPKRNEQP
jgi:hypothetical protein